MSGLPRAAVAAAVIVSIAGTAVDAQLRRPSPAELTPLLETDAVRAGTTARAALVIRLSEGLHTNSNRPRDPLLIPIVLSFQPPAGVSVTEVVYPEPTDLKQEGSAQPLAVFEREFKLGVQMAVAADAPPGELVVPASLRYQACDEKVCYPPVTLPASWTLRVVARNAAVSPVNAAALKTIRFGTGEPPPANASVPAVIAPGESNVASTPFTEHRRTHRGLRRHWNGRRLPREPRTSCSSSGTRRPASRKRDCSKTAGCWPFSCSCCWAASPST